MTSIQAVSDERPKPGPAWSSREVKALQRCLDYLHRDGAPRLPAWDLPAEIPSRYAHRPVSSNPFPWAPAATDVVQASLESCSIHVCLRITAASPEFVRSSLVLGRDLFADSTHFSGDPRLTWTDEVGSLLPDLYFCRWFNPSGNPRWCAVPLTLPGGETWRHGPLGLRFSRGDALNAGPALWPALFMQAYAASRGSYRDALTQLRSLDPLSEEGGAHLHRRRNQKESSGALEPEMWRWITGVSVRDSSLEDLARPGRLCPSAGTSHAATLGVGRRWSLRDSVAVWAQAAASLVHPGPWRWLGGVIPYHAYGVLGRRVEDGHITWLLSNPWGVDFWVSEAALHGGKLVVLATRP